MFSKNQDSQNQIVLKIFYGYLYISSNGVASFVVCYWNSLVQSYILKSDWAILSLGEESIDWVIIFSNIMLMLYYKNTLGWSYYKTRSKLRILRLSKISNPPMKFQNTYLVVILTVETVLDQSIQYKNVRKVWKRMIIKIVYWQCPASNNGLAQVPWNTFHIRQNSRRLINVVDHNLQRKYKHKIDFILIE